MRIQRIVPFCLLNLTILIFASCATSDPDVLPVESTIQEETPLGPEQTLDDQQINDMEEPEITDTWPTPIYGEDKEFVILVEGEEETVTMTYTVLDFSHWSGAADVGLYIDRERYYCYSFEGEYDIVPVDHVYGEPTSWVHVYSIGGETAQEGFDDLKYRIENPSYSGDFDTEIMSEGTIELDNHTALYIATNIGATYYVIDYDGGCISLSLIVTPEAEEGHDDRLWAMAKTIIAVE